MFFWKLFLKVVWIAYKVINLQYFSQNTGKYEEHSLNTFQFHLKNSTPLNSFLIDLPVEHFSLANSSTRKQIENLQNALSGHNNTSTTVKPKTIASKATIVPLSLCYQKLEITSLTKVMLVSGLSFCCPLDCTVVIVSTSKTDV